MVSCVCNLIYSPSRKALLLSPRGVGQALRIHMKKIHSILTHAESLRRFTEFKQAHVSSNFAAGSIGINAWNIFALEVEYTYIVRKSEKSLDMGEPTFHAEKTCILLIAAAANQSACFSYSMANYS